MNITPDWAESLGQNAFMEYAKKGFIISCIGGEKYKAQRIDEPEAWKEDLGFVPPMLESDEKAKELAMVEGFEFNDIENPFLVTGKH